MTVSFHLDYKNFWKLLCVSSEFLLARKSIEWPSPAPRLQVDDFLKIHNLHWELVICCSHITNIICTRYNSTNTSSARSFCNFGPLIDLENSVFKKILVDDRVPERRDSHASSSFKSPSEPTSVISADLGKQCLNSVLWTLAAIPARWNGTSLSAPYLGLRFDLVLVFWLVWSTSLPVLSVQHDHMTQVLDEESIPHWSSLALVSLLLDICEGASRHLPWKEKNASLPFPLIFEKLSASLHAASRAPCSCHSVSSWDRCSNFGGLGLPWWGSPGQLNPSDGCWSRMAASRRTALWISLKYVTQVSYIWWGSVQDKPPCSLRLANSFSTQPLHFYHHSSWTLWWVVHKLTMCIRALLSKICNHSWSCRANILQGATFHKMNWCKFLWSNPCRAIETFCSVGKEKESDREKKKKNTAAPKESRKKEAR